MDTAARVLDAELVPRHSTPAGAAGRQPAAANSGGSRVAGEAADSRRAGHHLPPWPAQGGQCGWRLSPAPKPSQRLRRMMINPQIPLGWLSWRRSASHLTLGWFGRVATQVYRDPTTSKTFYYNPVTQVGRMAGCTCIDSRARHRLMHRLMMRPSLDGWQRPARPPTTSYRLSKATGCTRIDSRARHRLSSKALADGLASHLSLQHDGQPLIAAGLMPAHY